MDAAPQQWSACSCVSSTSLTSRKSMPARAQRRRVSRNESPASTSTRVAPASTHKALPPLPLDSTHNRTGASLPRRPAATALAEGSDKPQPGGWARENARAASHVLQSRFPPREPHAQNEEEREESQQGEEQGAQAPARPSQEESAQGNPRPLRSSILDSCASWTASARQGSRDRLRWMRA